MGGLAVVAQVGAYDPPQRRRPARDPRHRGQANARRTALSRAAAAVAGQLHGHMIREYQIFAPIEDLGHRPNLPAVLVIDAANDELIDIRQHGQRFYERLSGPKQRVVLPGIKYYDLSRRAARAGQAPGRRMVRQAAQMKGCQRPANSMASGVDATTFGAALLVIAIIARTSSKAPVVTLGP